MTGRVEDDTVDELVVTRFWMGGVIAVMVIYVLIALVGHRRNRKPASKLEPPRTG
jgi:heme/copper-type cytochrome/quinol oxidase subunit 2